MNLFASFINRDIGFFALSAMMLRRCHPASCDENPGIEHITRVRRAPPGDGGGSPAHRRAPRGRPAAAIGRRRERAAGPTNRRPPLTRCVNPCAAYAVARSIDAGRPTRNGCRNGGNARISIAESERRIDHRPALAARKNHTVNRLRLFLLSRNYSRPVLAIVLRRTRRRDDEFTARSWRARTDAGVSRKRRDFPRPRRPPAGRDEE